jgi:hypothetical protein
MVMANVAKLLSGAPGKVDLLSQLELHDDEQALLHDAQFKIRNRLRERFEAWTRQNLGQLLTPRFFKQGSSAYKTLNRPAWLPPQRMDLDDGAYLPMTFVKGTARPSVAAATFFKLVDATLQELIAEERWSGFEPKPTCSRVVLTGKAHIDIPLYAIPDQEFAQLRKAMDHAMRADAQMDFMETRRRPDTWTVLPSDRVLLAHREEDWKPSDPRKIHQWFLAAVEFYGEILRRQCRYLKAWRDHQRLSHISSIILMAYAWKVFEEIGTANIPRRDDLMLLNIAERLPELMAQPIDNPADRSEKLGESWSHQDRRAAIKQAAEMLDQLNSAIHQCYLPDVALERMRAVFGDRIPNRPDLVGVQAAAKVEVRSHEKLYTAAPIVGRSVSG